MAHTPADIKHAVRSRYAAAALQVGDGCCDDGCCGDSGGVDAGAGFGADLYGELDAGEAPDAARLASLGCGNPTAVAGLAAGEVVLDLGSGGGLDVFLAARRVGPAGRAIGLDMTPEMVDLARRNRQRAGLANVEFLLGEMEDIPLPDASVDVIISNCVVNLSPDKAAVFREAQRVLRPGGRFVVSDVVTTRPFSEEEKQDLGAWTGCIAGALSQEEFESGLRAAGFRAVTTEVDHPLGTDVVSAIITAVR